MSKTMLGSLLGAKKWAFWGMLAAVTGIIIAAGCSNETGVGPGGKDSNKEEAVRENSVGKTEDGHDVLVFQEGELDDFLFKIDTIAAPGADTGFTIRLYFRGLDARTLPRVGDIIASGATTTAEGGFLYRVISVSEENGVTVVHVRDAGLSEVVLTCALVTASGIDFPGCEGRTRENIVGRTEDGRNVLFFQEGRLDDILFRIDTIAAGADTGLTVNLYFRGLDARTLPLVGDIIASEPTTAAENGFLYSVTGVSVENDVIVVQARGVGPNVVIDVCRIFAALRITFPGCRAAGPRVNSVGKTEDGHNVLVFEEGALDNILTKVDTVRVSDTLTAKLFFRGLGSEEIPEAGDIIASYPTTAAEYGFLYKVRKIYEENGMTVAEVREAALEEAIEDDEFRGEATAEFDEDGNLIRVMQKSTSERGGVRITADKTINIAPGTSIGVTAAYSLKINFHVNVKTWKLQAAHMILEQGGDVTINGNIEGGVNHTYDQRLSSLSLPSIVFKVFFIPVVITNQVVLDLVAEGDVSGSLAAKYTLKGSGEYGFRYKRNDGGVSLVNTNNFNKEFDYRLDISGRARIGVIAGLESRLYGLAGLALRTGPALELTANATPTGTQVFDQGFQSSSNNDVLLYYGLLFRIDITLRVLGSSLRNYSLYDQFISGDTLARASFLPRFDEPTVTVSSEGATISSRIEREKLNYSVREFGICIEKHNSNEGRCEDGSGKRWYAADPSGLSGAESRDFTTSIFTELSPGLNSARPFFRNNQGGTFYDKEKQFSFIDSTTQYTLTVNQNLPNGGTVTGGGPFFNGVSAPITATAGPGHRFIGWTGDEIYDTSSDSTTVEMTADRTVTANFEIFTHTLTVNTDPPNGGTVTGSGIFDWGTNPIITVTANPGFRFVIWEGIGIADSISESTTVHLLADRTITAMFARTHTLTVTSNPTTGGTVTGGGTFFNRQSAPITATANAGYRFTGWVGDGVADPSSESTTVAMTTNRTVVANFERIPTYTLTVTSNPTTGGTVTDGGTFEEGTEATITATANAGYRFTNWTGSIGGIADPNSASTIVSMTRNRTVVANFEIANSGTFIDARDDQTYRWVRIGDQIWMAENLNFNASGSVCYDDDPANCAVYGRLYDWPTLMNGTPSSSASPSGVQGVCPAGWHVPSDAEWITLTDFLDNRETEGTMLKSVIGWAYDGNGTDNYGFSALPAGEAQRRGESGSIFFQGNMNISYWWSATEAYYNEDHAWFRYISSSGVSRYPHVKTEFLYSLRCIQN